MVGLFDLPAPFLSLADHGLRVIVPKWGCLLIWGAIAGTASMTIYRTASPQQRIQAIKIEAEQAHNAMRAYDGDFEGLLPLARRTVELSIRHLGLALGAAMAASLPALFLIGFLDSAYGYVCPQLGTPVAVRIEPRQVPVRWSAGAQVRGGAGVWTMKWPGSMDPVTVSTLDGVRVARFPLTRPIPELRTFNVWNLLYGNPAGYLPAGANIKAISVVMPQAQYFSIGPAWLRGWETLFFLSAAFFSLAIKFRLGVH